MRPDRWRYDAATGEFVRYSVALINGLLTARAQGERVDAREAWDVRTERAALATLREWGLHATRAEALADLEREHAEASRRLDLARAAVRSVARSVRR